VLNYQGKKATFRANSTEIHKSKNSSSKISLLFFADFKQKVNLIFKLKMLKKKNIELGLV